jgi:anti-sigma factor RsiW
MAGVDERTSMLLSSYLDGELTRDELSEVVDALETNLDAVAEFRHIQATRRAVRLLPILNPPLDLMPGGHLGEQLSAYLDGELITMEMPAVNSHLATCSDCRRELADLDRARTAIRALPGIEPPAFLSPRIEEKAYTPSPIRRIGIRTAVAVAAGVAAVSLAFAVAPRGDDSTPAAVSIVELGSRHDARASTGVAVGLP